MSSKLYGVADDNNGVFETYQTAKKRKPLLNDGFSTGSDAKRRFRGR
jgi:hypothetical protein